MLQLPQLAALRELECSLDGLSLDEAVMQSLSSCRGLTRLHLEARGAENVSRFLSLLPSHPLPALHTLSCHIDKAVQADLRPLIPCTQLFCLSLSLSAAGCLSPLWCQQLRLPSAFLPSLQQVDLTLF